MRRLNILHLVDAFAARGGRLNERLHGVTRLLSWWLPAHDASRFRVSAATFEARDLAGEYLENLGVRIDYLGRGERDPRSVLDLARLLRRRQVDLLHLHGQRSDGTGRLLGRLRGIPCVLHGHAIAREGMGRVQRLQDRVLSSATSYSLAVSRRVRDFLVRHRSLPPSRVEVLPGGVPVPGPSRVALPFGPERRDLAAWRRLHRIPEDHRVVVVMGDLEPDGGHEGLLEAASQVLASFRNVSFALLGDGPLQPHLRRRAEALGIAPRVAFLEADDDASRILAGSDIAVFPASSDAGPLALFEAMASACAIVISRGCALAEIVEDGETGFVVPPDRPPLVAARLTRLLDQPALARLLAQQARRAVERFEVKRAVARLEQIYAALVLPGARPTPAGGG